jgi:hypothetical protein
MWAQGVKEGILWVLLYSSYFECKCKAQGKPQVEGDLGSPTHAPASVCCPQVQSSMNILVLLLLRCGKAREERQVTPS